MSDNIDTHRRLKAGLQALKGHHAVAIVPLAPGETLHRSDGTVIVPSAPNRTLRRAASTGSNHGSKVDDGSINLTGAGDTGDGSEGPPKRLLKPYKLRSKKHALVLSKRKGVTANTFCPTGVGGGVDPSCSPGGAASDASSESRSSGARRESKARVTLAATNSEMTPQRLKEFKRQLKESATAYERDAVATTDPVERQGIERVALSRRVMAKDTADQLEKTVKQHGYMSRLFSPNSGGNPDVASAVGAPDNATITVRAYPDGVSIWVKHPEYTASRTASIDDDGKKVMHNDAFFASSQGTGLGSKVFSEQVANLRSQGFDRIETWAAKGSGMNGYYTWARLGYDQKISEFRDRRTRDRILKEFPEAKSVQDIMATENGRTWWKKNGTNMRKAKFDLNDGSRSMQVHEAYLAERAARKKPTSNESWEEWLRGVVLVANSPNEDNLDDIGPDDKREAENIDLTEEEEEVLERAWRRLTRQTPADNRDYPEIPHLPSNSGNPGIDLPVWNNPSLDHWSRVMSIWEGLGR